MKKRAIDIIESAKSYYLLSKDHAKYDSKPVRVGNRLRLEFALQDVDADMVIATSGNDKRCIVLMDYSIEDIMLLIYKGDRAILKLKEKN